MDSVCIIVDMVNDFVRPEGKLSFPRAAGVIEPIVRLRAAFRAAGVPVVYDNDAHPEDSGEFTVWPPHCLMGSWGAQLIDDLAAGPGDIIFHKDSLTFFYSDEAEKLLRGLGAGHLYLVGVATEYCVKHCALDALARGFAVTVVTDAIAGVDLAPGDCDRAIEAMRQAGAAFAASEAVLATLAKG